MKKLLVYDVAADSGGALTILRDYYNRYTNDLDTEVYFILSVIKFPETKNVHIINLPWVKKSWFHRLFCEYYYVQKLIKKYNIDEVLSLQNIAINRCKVFQTVYVQNALPFTTHGFSPFKETYLWIYKNLIGFLTKRSLKKADRIIVQTKWMKKAICDSCNIPDDIVEVEKYIGKLNLEKREVPNRNDNGIVFFYPASCFIYKNHDLIIKSCKALKNEGINNYKVVLTISGNENSLAVRLFNEINSMDLPVECVGRLERERMEEYYKKAVLIFPSYLETVGLPLIEAQVYNTFILAADCEYAKESLEEYDKKAFFSINDHEELTNLMKAVILGQIQ